MELCAQDGAMCPRYAAFYFFTRKTGRWRGGPQTYWPVFREQNFYEDGRRQERREFSFGRGSVAPSTRSASQTAIEPIVSVNILISHIPPCIAPYTLISRTPPPPTPVGGITPNSSQFIVRLVVNQPEPTRSIRVLRSRLLFERNTDS